MISITRAGLEDAEAILALQKLAYQSEARIYNDWSLPPLVQSLDSLCAEMAESSVLKALREERIVGSVRAQLNANVCAIGRLIVHPDFQGQGIGSQLLREIELCFPAAATYELFTGSQSEGNIRLYSRHGYAVTHTKALSPTVSLVFMNKAGAR
jgi:predicted N-acetyltransferase YhbS